MIYYDLTIPLRCIVILSLFLAFCFCAYLLSLLRLRKKQKTIALTLSAMVVSGTLMIIYTAEARANLRSLSVPKFLTGYAGKVCCFQSLFFL